MVYVAYLRLTGEDGNSKILTKAGVMMTAYYRVWFLIVTTVFCVLLSKDLAVPTMLVASMALMDRLFFVSSRFRKETQL
jgi:hypothetical protein